jgi:hypothetical protein
MKHYLAKSFAGGRLRKKTAICLALASAAGFALAGCIVRQKIKVAVPPKILNAKSASFDQLLDMARRQSTQVESLLCSSLKVTLKSGRLENGVLQSYPSAPGYLLLKRPDIMRMSIQYPVTKTAIADMLSVGDDFEIWVPKSNKFFVGKNSMKEFEAEGNSGIAEIPLRPVHILDALLPPSITPTAPGERVALEEDQDATAKYYIISVYRDAGDSRLLPMRKLWIERSDLALVRQQVFEDQGRLKGIIQYSNLTTVEGVLLPMSISIDRPSDGYSLDLECKNWKLNPNFDDNAFILPQPEGALRIQLKEKGGSDKP